MNITARDLGKNWKVVTGAAMAGSLTFWGLLIAAIIRKSKKLGVAAGIWYGLLCVASFWHSSVLATDYNGYLEEFLNNSVFKD